MISKLVYYLSIFRQNTLQKVGQDEISKKHVLENGDFKLLRLC